MKILIVDDIEEIVINIDKIIRYNLPDASIEHAFTAEDAMLKYDEFKPDFVLLDLSLGKRSGLDVLKYIKKEKSNTKVIIVTNCNEAYYFRKCSEMGADYFIDKSKEFNELPKILNWIV